MFVYLIFLGVGILIGVVYVFFKVCLLVLLGIVFIGLLGMVLVECLVNGLGFLLGY